MKTKTVSHSLLSSWQIIQRLILIGSTPNNSCQHAVNLKRLLIKGQNQSSCFYLGATHFFFFLLNLSVWKTLRKENATTSPPSLFAIPSNRLFYPHLYEFLPSEKILPSHSSENTKGNFHKICLNFACFLVKLAARVTKFPSRLSSQWWAFCLSVRKVMTTGEYRYWCQKEGAHRKTVHGLALQTEQIHLHWFVSESIANFIFSVRS